MPNLDHRDDLFKEDPLREGEEQAPRGTRTMGIVRWALLIGLSAFALIMILTYFGATPWGGGTAAASQYHCPMHPTYISNQPGDCPICGMSLVPINAEVDADSAAAAEHGIHEEELGLVSVAEPGQYYCPMDPKVASDTAGRCPICGMHLEKLEPGMTFTCEMHPEVITDRPGDCPICGMDLIPIEVGVETGRTDRADHTSDMDEAPVPGLVPVVIEPERLQLIGIKTSLVEHRPLDDKRQLVGYVTPDETRMTNLNVRVSGWVQKLNIDQTGQKVAKGQPLLTLYSQDLYQAQQDFLAALRTAQRQSGDSALVATRDGIVEATRDRLRLLGLTTEEINRIESATETTSDIALRSPINGVVLEKNVLPGQYITPDQSLFTVADLSRVWVLADVYESDLAAIEQGQKAIMTVTAFPSEVFEGEVGFIYPTVDPQTRTLKLRLEFANPDMKLRPGMYAQVNLQSDGAQVLAIPRNAIMDGGDIDYAFVMHGSNRFEPRQVKTGRSSDDWVEVTEGLSHGERVVTSANFLIDSESRLQAAISGMGGATTEAGAGAETPAASGQPGHVH